MDNKELIAIASKAEWTLECDRKMLEIMQSLASKIENRAVNTNIHMNKMILSLDQTKVNMSNFTRINDVKEKVYCENLISSEETDSISDVPKNQTVKLSAQIAIENGLKLMENCFEKHRVNLDPSSSRSETTIVYRPIDNFYSPLPYLIGTDKWKEKWHLGLIEEDRSSQTGSTYSESVDSNVTPSSLLRNESENPIAGSSLMASQDSLAKSSDSIGDHMIINQPNGIFDEIYEEQPIAANAATAQPSSYFMPQPTERKIINLFDDEPPEDISPVFQRKPVNLFDDADSVESLAIPPPKVDNFEPPPVLDLFNDNEFDSFIAKMESNQSRNQNQTVVSRESEENTFKEKKKLSEPNVQRDMKIIAQEIKKVQLKKVELLPQQPIEKVREVISKQIKPKEEIFKAETIKKSEIKADVKPLEEKKKEIKVEEPPLVVKSRPKITNLFDDEEDESEDFFNEIMKQKASNLSNTSAKIQSQPDATNKANLLPEKKKISNLFDDDDNDDTFDNIFSNKSPSLNVSTPKHLSDDKEKIPELINERFKNNKNNDKSNVKTHLSFEPPILQDSATRNKQITSSKEINDNDRTTSKKSLFDDDDDDDQDLFKIKSSEKAKVGQQSEKNIKENNEQNLSSKAQTLVSDESTSMEEAEKNDEISENSPNSSSSSSNIVTEIVKSDILKNTPNESNDESVTQSEFKTSNDQVPNIEIEKSKLSEEKVETIRESEYDFSPNKDFNSTLPFLSDLPPDDDVWETEDNNYEEPETKSIKETQKPFNPNASNYAIPLFDDVPPDDDFDNQAPPIPEPNFDDEEEEYEEVKESIPIPKEIPLNIPIQDDEIDRSTVTIGNIKSKMDIFTKSQESSPPTQSEPKKLPGKLNTGNFKINVGALMPGAKLPIAKKSQEPPAIIDDEPAESKPANNQEKLQNSPSSIEKSADATNTGMLNNDLAKSRAKIQVKRRPSTRRGRRTIYEKSLNEQLNENDEEEENQKSDKSLITEDKLSQPLSIGKELSSTEGGELRSRSVIKNEPATQSSTKNIAKNIFDDDDDDKPSIHEQLKDDKSNFFNEEPPPLEYSQIEKKFTTNKVSVFYDDEDETKKMLEEQKLKKDVGLFDNVEDNIFGSQPKIQTPTEVKKSTSNLSKALFSEETDDDDEDIFSPKKNLKAKEEEKPLKKEKSLFDNDDDELFKSSGSANKKVEKTSKLFDSDEEEKHQSSLIFSKPKSSTIGSNQLKKQSLFGDSDDDDDNLFSTKSKNVPSKSSAAITKTTIVKKSASTVVNDPLKDLLDN